jgi:putative ABC transport system ATP-binding protein
MTPLVQTAQVTRVYGARGAAVRALDRIDLTIVLGEFVAIMGPSGSGKSTLMNILGLLDRPTEGKYRLAGEDVGSFEHDKLAKYRNRYIGFVFQGFNLLPRVSAAENVALPLVYRGVQAMERRGRATAALEAVGLGKRFHHRPQELSGGEQQRVAIARAMVGNPLLLLADEPTGALDTETGKDILALFHRLHGDGRTIVLITHDPSVARHATRIISLADGRVVNERISVSADEFARQQEAANDCPA